MNNSLVNKLYSKELIGFMNDKLDEIIENNYSVDDIYTMLKSSNESFRIGIYLLAQDRGNEKVAEKISKVNEMLVVRRRKEFEQAYKKGETDRFLASMGKADKMALMKDLGIDVPIAKRIHFSSEQRNYYEILSNSILEDQVNDERDGIDQFVTYKKEDKVK